MSDRLYSMNSGELSVLMRVASAIQTGFRDFARAECSEIRVGLPSSEGLISSNLFPLHIS